MLVLFKACMIHLNVCSRFIFAHVLVQLKCHLKFQSFDCIILTCRYFVQLREDASFVWLSEPTGKTFLLSIAAELYLRHAVDTISTSENIGFKVSNYKLLYFSIYFLEGACPQTPCFRHIFTQEIITHHELVPFSINARTIE